MKNLKFFFTSLICMLFITGCTVGVLPTDPVGLPAAFAHCAESTSYWVWGIITTLVVGATTFIAIQKNKFSSLLFFGCAVALVLAWCYRPSELAWNTTVEQAARGVWIGY